jgi:hypothetical protein
LEMPQTQPHRHHRDEKKTKHFLQMLLLPHHHTPHTHVHLVASTTISPWRRRQTTLNIPTPKISPETHTHTQTCAYCAIQERRRELQIAPTHAPTHCVCATGVSSLRRQKLKIKRVRSSSSYPGAHNTLLLRLGTGFHLHHQWCYLSPISRSDPTDPLTRTATVSGTPPVAAEAAVGTIHGWLFLCLRVPCSSSSSPFLNSVISVHSFLWVFSESRDQKDNFAAAQCEPWWANCNQKKNASSNINPVTKTTNWQNGLLGDE